MGKAKVWPPQRLLLSALPTKTSERAIWGDFLERGQVGWLSEVSKGSEAAGGGRGVEKGRKKNERLRPGKQGLLGRHPVGVVVRPK